MTKHVLSGFEEHFRSRIIALKPKDGTGYCLYEKTVTGNTGRRIAAETGEALCCKDVNSFEFPRNCDPGVYYLQFYAENRRPLNVPQQTLVTWAGSGGGARPNPDVREAAQQQLRLARQFTVPDLPPSVLEHPDYLSAQLDHGISSLAYSERNLLTADTRQAIYTQEVAEVHALASFVRKELASQISTGNAQLERCHSMMQAMQEVHFGHYAKMNVAMESQLAAVASMADKLPTVAQKLATPEPPGSSARAWGETIVGILQSAIPLWRDATSNVSAPNPPRTEEEVFELLDKLAEARGKKERNGEKSASPPTKIVDSKPSGAVGS